MADIKISQLTSAQQITGSEMIPLTSGAATVKATPALIKEYAIGDTDISSIGDGTPTGAIASLESSKADTSDLGTAAAKDSTNAVTQNSTDLVESGAVYTGLAAKANTSDLGTAAAKDSTNAVTQNSTDLIESGAVYTGLAGKANSADLATVATSGLYNDLLNKPTLGTAAAKASTNAVTQNSTDLVESGAVYSSVDALSSALTNVTNNYQNVKLMHNIPRLVPKDITSYFTDGTFYKRLAGTDGFELFEDLYVGDYAKMSRAISAYERTGQYQTTGSQYVTIAGLDMHYGDGDGGDSVSALTYHHADMVAGQGFGGTQHFGRSRMNSSNTTTGGYVGSEMHTTTIGAVTSSGATGSTATINQQLYAEFGSHLKTHRCLLSNAMTSTNYNRFGTAGGAASGWAWTSVQAVLLSEIECYGSTVWSSSGYDTGNGNKQLPLFAHAKQAMNNRTAYYWLRDVASSADFCFCRNIGFAGFSGASGADRDVRPRFILA